MEIINGKSFEWEIVVGFEVHAQIVSQSKLFSSAAAEFGSEPNTNVSFVDCAMPGMLPTLNEECVKQAVATGLALNAEVQLYSAFDRKSYFYPDLPQGYQITQFYNPIALNGYIDLSNGNRIRIARLHMEQDAGKSMHIGNKTFIDLNRAGVGLMEIVTEPDITSIDDGVEFLKKLRMILRYVGSCDGDMEKGSLRCDANVSVKIKGSDKLGTRCEIKNLNSIKHVQQAVLYEANRQVELLENGGSVEQSTMSFDTTTGVTSVIRTKEDASEYRYLPDPDLQPLVLDSEFISFIKGNLPELPEAKKERYVSQFGLSLSDADVIISDKNVALYFEEVATVHDPKISSNWIVVELFALLKKNNLSILESPISTANLIGLLDNIKNGTLSGKMAKEVFSHMFSSSKSASDIIKEFNIKQITDEGEILLLIQSVLNSNVDKVESYRSGKDRIYPFFVGQVMKLSSGKASPEMVNKLLLEQLKK